MAKNWAQLLTEELESKVKIMEEEFMEELEVLTDELTEMSPVDTGHLKDSWERPIKVGENRYRLINSAEYAWFPLIMGNSSQLPMGILPHIREWKTRIGGR